MEEKKILDVLETKPYLKKDLFIRGFLITENEPNNLDDFPFYGNWNIEYHNGFYFIAHFLTGMHIYEENDNTFFIMGHAYNPFTMECDEINILKKIAESYGTDEYMEQINDLTGVFVYGNIKDGKLSYLVDPSGMQSACSGIIKETFYLSSHPQLIGDICDLAMDPLVEELINYKWYGRVMGPYLPGDLTPFREIKRIVPSIIYTFSEKNITHKRYWPLSEIKIASDEDEYKTIIEKAAEILKNNMILVSNKWNKPWISLTGGIDSNTTFAAANNNYKKFQTFSYISAEKEVPVGGVQAARDHGAGRSGGVF